MALGGWAVRSARSGPSNSRGSSSARRFFDVWVIDMVDVELKIHVHHVESIDVCAGGATVLVTTSDGQQLHLELSKNAAETIAGVSPLLDEMLVS